MTLLRGAAVLVALLVLAAGAWVRFAPTDATRWHRAQSAPPEGDRQGPNSFDATRPVSGDPAAALARADAVIRATPRTHAIAGSLEEGRITYVTRSRLWGFPDFTTLSLEHGPRLRLHGRARFGRSDLGVNEARIRGWLGQLDLGP